MVTDTLTASPQKDPNLVSRIVGVYFSPEETFRAVVARPRWLGVMAITLVIGAACQYVIMSSPELQEAMIDQQIRAMESRGGASEQQIAGVERFISLMPVIYTAVTFVLGPLFVAALAGIFVGVFTTLMGGQGTFKQMYSVMTHSGLISMLSGVFSAALVAAGVSPTGIRPPGANLGVFVPMLEETSFVAVMLRTLDFFLLWWLVVLAIGVGVLYKRRPGGIAATLIGIYVVIALVVAAFASGS
jgi:hypothetical protein